MSRRSEYKKLIEEAKGAYSISSKEGIELQWCDECKEINLWTYWQGREAIKQDSNVKIMVVGQDWGNPASNEQVMQNIKNMNAGYTDVSYLDNVKMFPTDIALVDIFRDVLGIDLYQKNNDIFFTNFCLGYRTGKQSGGLKYRQLASDSNKVLFKRLVDIVKPEIIVPLGQLTYRAVCEALDITKPNIRGFNRLLDIQNDQDFGLCYKGEKYIARVVPMAHPGKYGQMNRKREDRLGIEQIKVDWENLR